MWINDVVIHVLKLVTSKQLIANINIISIPKNIFSFSSVCPVIKTKVFCRKNYQETRENFECTTHSTVHPTFFP